MDYLQENNAIGLEDINLLEEDGDSRTIFDDEGIHKEDKKSTLRMLFLPVLECILIALMTSRNFTKNTLLEMVSGQESELREKTMTINYVTSISVFAGGKVCVLHTT